MVGEWVGGRLLEIMSPLSQGLPPVKARVSAWTGAQEFKARKMARAGLAETGTLDVYCYY